MSGGRSSAALTTNLDQLVGRGGSGSIMNCVTSNKLLLLNNLGVDLRPEHKDTLNKSDSLKQHCVLTTGEFMPSFNTYGIPKSVDSVIVHPHHH